VTRRLATVVLHWSVATLLLLVLASGAENLLLILLFCASGAAMTGLAVIKGLMNGPGPKLSGPLRQLHPWISRVMYALLALSVIALLAPLLGWALPVPPRAALLALLGAGMLHGIFNLWRSSALNDGALRRMMF
jgi:hypothetical protein